LKGDSSDDLWKGKGKKLRGKNLRHGGSQFQHSAILQGIRAEVRGGVERTAARRGTTKRRPGDAPYGKEMKTRTSLA